MSQALLTYCQALVDSVERALLGQVDQLNGQCRNTAAWLVQYLQAEELDAVMYDGRYEWYAHSWVVVNKRYLLDPTIAQFNPAAPRVVDIARGLPLPYHSPRIVDRDRIDGIVAAARVTPAKDRHDQSHLQTASSQLPAH